MSDEVEQWGEDYDPDDVAQRIYHLRKIGESFPDIRKYLDHDGIALSLSQVVGLFRGFQKSLATAYGPEDREQLLGMELERLDELQRAWWTEAQTEVAAAKLVLDISKQRSKLLGLDVPDGTDKNVQQTVLIIGDDKRSFMEALQQGKDSRPPMLTSHVLDDGGVPKEEADE